MDMSIVGANIGKCTLCTSDICVREFKVQLFECVFYSVNVVRERCVYMCVCKEIDVCVEKTTSVHICCMAKQEWHL